MIPHSNLLGNIDPDWIGKVDDIHCTDWVVDLVLREFEAGFWFDVVEKIEGFLLPDLFVVGDFVKWFDFIEIKTSLLAHHRHPHILRL